MTSTVWGVLAAAWGVVMALAPALQVRRMLLTRSSADVSVGYFLMLVPGFLLWCAYGASRRDWVIVAPNALAAVGGVVTIAVAWYLRDRDVDRRSGRRCDRPGGVHEG